MIDQAKTYKTRDGRPALILTTTFAATQELKSLMLDSDVQCFIGSEDEVAALVTNEDGSTEVNGYDDGGRFSSVDNDEDDLIEVTPRTSVFRTFNPESPTSLGGVHSGTLFGAQALIRAGSEWEGVREFISEGGAVVDVRFHPKAPAE